MTPKQRADAERGFPSFDYSTMPPLPADWQYTGDGGAVGPSFYAPYEGRNGEWEGFSVIIDYADPKDREIPNSCRFHILVDDAGCSTDDWNFVMLIDQMRREANNYVAIQRLIDED